MERSNERKRLAHKIALWCGLILWTLALSWGCGSEEQPTSSNTSCVQDADCPLGTVCQLSSKQCLAIPCETDGNFNCLMGQICLQTEADPAGVCSRPECKFPADCASKPGTSCIKGQCLAAQCTRNDECDPGEYCTVGNQCEEVPTSCKMDEDCKDPGRVCTDAGICRPGCSSDEACEADKYCDTAQKVCAPGCRDSTQCEGQLDTCSEDHKCVCSADSCPGGTSCVSGVCKVVESCDDAGCTEDQYCDPDDGFSCKDKCTVTGCDAMPGTVCDAQTGRCIADQCGGKTAADCTDPNKPHFSASTCECIECLTFNDCDVANGEICSDGGTCIRCENACDSNTPGQCDNVAGGATPFCIAGCCSECIGDLDCDDPAKPLCINGFCQSQPDCLTDPSACPTGYTCDAQGMCQPPQSGGMCNPQDGTGCTPPLVCNPFTSMCEQGGSTGMGCGLCNPDCTCNGQLQCDPLFQACTGCDPLPPLFGGDPNKQCPSGQTCFPFFNICLQ